MNEPTDLMANFYPDTSSFRKALIKACKEQYPRLDELMIESAVDVFLKNPDMTPDEILDSVPENYFDEKNVKEVQVQGGEVPLLPEQEPV